LWHFSRWHFNPWTVCFPGLLLPSESNFPQYALCFTGVSVAQQIAPIVKYPQNWGWCAWSAEGSLKRWLLNGKLLFCLTKCHGVPCSLPSRITTSLEKLQDFLQDWDQDQMFKTKTLWSKTKTFIFVLEAPRDQDWSWGLITGCFRKKYHPSNFLQHEETCIDIHDSWWPYPKFIASKFYTSLQLVQNKGCILGFPGLAVRSLGMKVPSGV